MKKKILIILVLIFIMIPNMGFANLLGEDISTPIEEKAQVIEVREGEISPELKGFVKAIQYVLLEIKSGPFKGELIEVENYISENAIYEIFVEEGDRVIVVTQEEAGELKEVYISDYLRENYIYLLLGLFILLIIGIGGIKGIKSVLTLGLTIFLILKVMLPLMLQGIDPILISIAIAIVVTILTILIVGGINSKSISAILGTSIGVIIAGIIAFIVGNQINLTGLSGEEISMLMYIPQNIDLEFRSLLFAGIILGALGAIMDVGMSIASSIEEIYNANKNLTSKDLFKSGMNVGKDIMGTMTNTLILAYTGSSIPLLLLFMAYDTPIRKIMNLDLIATEIVRSLSGSIGLILTVPLTAFIASILVKKSKNREE